MLQFHGMWEQVCYYSNGLHKSAEAPKSQLQIRPRLVEINDDTRTESAEATATSLRHHYKHRVRRSSNIPTLLQISYSIRIVPGHY